MAAQEILLKPGQQIKPSPSTEEVHALVKKFYNLTVTSMKELNSYDDRSYYITVGDDSLLPFSDDICTHGYIFKIINSLDAKNRGFINAQTDIMLFLGQRNISCPRPIRNMQGNHTAMVKLSEDDDENCVRMLSYIPGTILFDVEYTKELFYEVGEWTAKTDIALMNFENSDLKINRIWNLSAVPKLTEFVYAITDEDRRALVMEVIENFEKNVVPHYGKLVHGAIHGDLNEQNILVNADSKGQFHVCGIIDFGDIHYNFYIFELAISCTYMMIECKTMDVLDAPGHVLAGYGSVRRIPPEEFGLLKSLISGRFAQSLILGAYSFLQNPDPYVLTTSKRGWNVLRKLWKCPQNELYDRWNRIIESYSVESKK